MLAEGTGHVQWTRLSLLTATGAIRMRIVCTAAVFVRFYPPDTFRCLVTALHCKHTCSDISAGPCECCRRRPYHPLGIPTMQCVPSGQHPPDRFYPPDNTLRTNSTLRTLSTPPSPGQIVVTLRTKSITLRTVTLRTITLRTITLRTELG